VSSGCESPPLAFRPRRLPSETSALRPVCDGQRSAPHQHHSWTLRWLPKMAHLSSRGRSRLQPEDTTDFKQGHGREVACGHQPGGAVPVRPRPSGWPLGGRILLALGPVRPAVIVVHVGTGRTKLSGAVGHVALPSIGDSATHFDVTRHLAGAVGRLTGDLCKLPMGAQLKFGFRAAWMERTSIKTRAIDNRT
jgi:hypothetical protein